MNKNLQIFKSYEEIDNVIKSLTKAMNSPILTSNMADDINVVIASIKDHFAPPPLEGEMDSGEK